MKSDTRYSNRRPGTRSERPVRDMRDQRTQKEQTVQLTVRGMARGAIRMEAEDGTIYTCAKENARGALFGDTVLAERIGRDRVVVAKVLTHAHENIMGVLRVHDGVRVIQPLERRLPAEIAVADLHAEAEDGEIVRTHVTRWEDEGGLCVSVEERIGSFEQSTYALDALVMSMHLRTDFPEDVLAEANACRPADLVPNELETLESEMKQYEEQPEDVLTYALFPQVATDFFKYRDAQQKKMDATIADTENGAYPV